MTTVKLSSKSKTILLQMVKEISWGSRITGNGDKYERMLFMLNVPLKAEIDDLWIECFERLTSKHPLFVGAEATLKEEADFILAEVRLKKKEERVGIFRARDWPTGL